MIWRITLFWIIGGLIIVPWCINRLLFHAPKDEYAFLIVFPLFWIFGFWGVVGPAIGAWRVRKLMNALDHVQDRQQLIDAYHRHEGKEVIVDLIASDTGLPRFIARRFYDRVVARLMVGEAAAQLRSMEPPST